MAKRPRQKGKKNKVTTMQEFIDSVGNILKTKGYYALRVNNIAQKSGRSRNLIGRYFTDVEGLQRAYVREKDYWTPFFKRFVLSDADGIEEVRIMFTALLQENFKVFYNSPDMQKIILWQISESNEIMSEFSKKRELQGEELFKITDIPFKNTEVNFRALVGLVLGGIYYMVLQAKTRNSVMCGMDVCIEADQIEVLKTVEQVIGWACAAANRNENNLPYIPMMTNQFELLDNVVAQLSAKNEVNDEPDILLKGEAKKLKRAIPNHVLTLNNDTQIRTYLKVVVTKLSEVIDELYHPEHHANPNADLIVEVLKTVIRHFFDLLPNELLLPKFFCIHEAVPVNLKWQKIKDRLEQAGIDPFLMDAIYYPINRLIIPEAEVSWYDYKYLKVYVSALGSEVAEFVLDEAALLDLVIGLGYNHTRFSAYYTGRLMAQLKGLEQSAKRGLLESVYTLVEQATVRTYLVFMPGKSGIVTDLQKWIAIELKKLDGLQILESGIADMSLNSNFSTAELACWQKIQLDAGVYVESGLDLFSEKVGFNFKTKGGVRPSSASVKSKLYGKKQEIYKTLGVCVNKMKEDIDRFLG